MNSLLSLINSKINELKKNKMDTTIRNFLSYTLDRKEYCSKVLSIQYSNEEEINKYIYNCAINTIDEYIDRLQSNKKELPLLCR